MTDYNVALELNLNVFDIEMIDDLMNSLADYHPSVDRSTLGRVLVTLTLPARSVREAATTAQAVVAEATTVTTVGMTVVRTSDFDILARTTTFPPCCTVPQAADRAGMSPQGIWKAIDRGALAVFRPTDRIVLVSEASLDAFIAAKEHRS